MSFCEGGLTPDVRAGSSPLLIASILREQGNTGVHTHVRELRRHLDESGVPATVVTPFSWGGALRLPVFGARLALHPWSRAAGVLWYRHWHELFLRSALQRRLSRLDEAIIYAQGPEAARASLLARSGRHQQVVMAVHYQTSQADGWAGAGCIRRGGVAYRAIRQMEKDVIPQLDGIVYVSRSARDHLVSWLPDATEVRSAIVPNFVVPVEAAEPRSQVADLVSVGSLLKGKNHRYLLEMLAAAKQGGRHLTLDVYGDGPLRRQLVRLAHMLGVDQQVRFIGYQPEVRRMLPAYRAYVHASLYEAAPLAIIEAMAAGLPVVAPGCGGVPELFDDGVEGRYWPIDDPAAAAATLMNLLDDEPARRNAGKAASARFEGHFYAKTVAPRLESFLFGTKPTLTAIAHEAHGRGVPGRARVPATVAARTRLLSGNIP